MRDICWFLHRHCPAWPVRRTFLRWSSVRLLADCLCSNMYPDFRKRLQDGGLNVVLKPHEPSGLHLLINQHFYQFWLLLVGASVLSILTYIIRFYTHNDDTIINLATACILLPMTFLMVTLSYCKRLITGLLYDSYARARKANYPHGECWRNDPIGKLFHYSPPFETSPPHSFQKNSTVLRDCRAMVVPTDHLVCWMRSLIQNFI